MRGCLQVRSYAWTLEWMVVSDRLMHGEGVWISHV